MNKPILLTVLSSALLAACGTLAPEYQQPAAPVAASWPAGSNDQSNAKTVAWHDFIQDAKLRRLVELALDNNRDLRVAILNVEKTQAQYQIQRDALFPHLNATAGENAALTPAKLSSTGNQIVSHAYSVGLGFSSYELDLFGRVRSLKDAALEQYFSTEESRRAAQISLIAQVAAAYITLDADQAHLKLATDTLSNQQAEYDLIQAKFKLGVASQLDLSQAESTLDTARGDVARYKGAVIQDNDALTLLVGTSVPADLVPTGEQADIVAVQDLPHDLPSRQLQQRPDILAAEHQLKSANANIGAARAAFFPSITLTTSIGTASNELSGLFKAGSRTWSFAPQINLPIFDGGSNIANLKVAKVNRDIYLAQYDKAIQQAFREVADSLADHDSLVDQIAAQQALVDANKSSYTLSDARYKRGVDSYQTVLTSQQLWYASQQNLIALKSAKTNNLLTLYKALGGGAS